MAAGRALPVARHTRTPASSAPRMAAAEDGRTCDATAASDPSLNRLQVSSN